MKGILKWMAGAATVLIGIFQSIYDGIRGDYAVAYLMTDELRDTHSVSHNVIWSNPSASLSIVRPFLNARDWK